MIQTYIMIIFLNGVFTMVNKNQSSTKDKIMTVIGTILCIILVPILVINCTLIVKSVTNKDEVPNIGGIFPLIVLTDSMYPEISSGDLIICHQEEPTDIQEGDIISFFDPAGNGTSIVTHRVIEVVEENGEISYKTKGDFNNTEDKLAVPADNLVGVYSMRIPALGNVALFMQSTTGLVVCVVCPIILLVAYDMIRRKQYEKNNKQDIDALMKELNELKAKQANKEE